MYTKNFDVDFRRCDLIGNNFMHKDIGDDRLRKDSELEKKCVKKFGDFENLNKLEKQKILFDCVKGGSRI